MSEKNKKEEQEEKPELAKEEKESRRTPPGFSFADELEMSGFIKMLVYGETGTGKTTLGCTAPNPVFALTEVGRSSKRIKVMSKVLKKDVLTYEVSSIELMKKFIRIAKKAAEKGMTWTIIFDSASHFYKIIIQTLLAGKSGSKKKKNEPLVPRLGDWSTIQAHMKETIEELVALPHHLVVLSHARNFTYEEDGNNHIKYVPAFKGDTLPFEIGGSFQAVGFMHRKKVKGKVRHLIGFNMGDEYTTKPDTGLDDIEKPNLEFIFEKMLTAAESGDDDFEWDYDAEDDDVSAEGEE